MITTHLKKFLKMSPNFGLCIIFYLTLFHSYQKFLFRNLKCLVAEDNAQEPNSCPQTVQYLLRTGFVNSRFSGKLTLWLCPSLVLIRCRVRFRDHLSNKRISTPAGMEIAKNVSERYMYLTPNWNTFLRLCCVICKLWSHMGVDLLISEFFTIAMEPFVYLNASERTAWIMTKFFLIQMSRFALDHYQKKKRNINLRQ
jgi:hypothetical protein